MATDYRDVEILGAFSKVCRQCKASKQLFEFARDPVQVDGMTQRCRTCRGTDEDEPMFDIQIRTDVPESDARHVYQFTRAVIENRDFGHFRDTLDYVLSIGRLSQRQYDLVVQFAQLIAMAFADKIAEMHDRPTLAGGTKKEN